MVIFILKYVLNLLIALDQLGNTLLCGNPDETLSSRMGKLIIKNECKLCKIICFLLNKIDSNHCNKSIEYDEVS